MIFLSKRKFYLVVMVKIRLKEIEMSLF